MKKINKKVENMTVVYDNELNLVQSSQLDIYELNLLFGVFSRFKSNPHEELVLSFDYMNMLSGRNKTQLSKDAKFAKKFLGHLVQSFFKIEEDGRQRIFPLLADSVIDPEKRTITIYLNKEAGVPEYFENLKSNFTKFNFSTYYHLKSKYSKALFRLLNQYKNTGYYRVDLSVLKFLMGCPDDFPTKLLFQKAINPAIKELLETNEIISLSLDKRKTGRIITGVVFNFKFKKDYEKIKDVTLTNSTEEFTDKEIVAGLNDNINWENNDEW